MNSLDYLLSFQRFGIKLGLDNITYLLHQLGNPHRDFPVIHITGTNGKGSVVSFIDAVLMRMGYKVGRYISPHLLDFSERIVVNGVPISVPEINELVDSLRPIVNDMQNNPSFGHPTFFEAVTAMAFKYFARHKVDFAVVEVGMGGRYDSTNVVQPSLSVITNVHMEHCDYLGGSLEEIAFEKAGIIKAGVEVVSGAEQPEVRRIIDTRAGECGAKVYYLSRDFHCQARSDVFPRQWVEFSSPWKTLKDIEINLAGGFQARNAALALMSLEILNRKHLISPNENALRVGMAESNWPARLERLTDSPLILLDGAHNPSAMLSLVDAISELFPKRRVVPVVGTLADKDVVGCLRELRKLSEILIATQPSYERALPAKRLADLAHGVFENVKCEQSIAVALQQALLVAAPEDIVLITGSLFNVAEVKEFVSTVLAEKADPRV
ncbi:MAG: bifunctional folylpolyglutamate synthase/dihydrofolate synthase [Candidatus Hydrogenedentota bacterium]|nr:MAG: bifunctional folylpolyglutamate synthase/dihydrofolate synthase [Candidatus Hydrogenedentota bacterium]